MALVRAFDPDRDAEPAYHSLARVANGVEAAAHAARLSREHGPGSMRPMQPEDSPPDNDERTER